MRLNKGIGPWILSACLLGLSYPSFGPNIPNGILAWFAFVPVLLALAELPSFKKLLIYSLIFNAIFLFIDTWWLGHFSIWKAAIVIFSQVPLLSVSWIVFYYIHKKWGWFTALFSFPFLWTLSDFMHHLMPHGMQIYLLPYTQSHQIWLIQFIDIFGMYGISFWVCLMNVLLVLFLSKVSFKRALIPLLWLALPLFYSFWSISLNPKGITGLGHKQTKVSIIQTNQDSYAERDSLHFQSVLDEIVNLCDSAVRKDQPDLMVLPEGAVPIHLLQNVQILDITRNLVNHWQTSLAIGFQNKPDSTKPYEFENDALIFTPQLAMFWDSLRIQPEDVKVYQKEHGLPFVEISPFFNETPTLANQILVSNKEIYTFNYQDFDNQSFKAALSICWEQLFPEKIAALIKDGAQFIALMNNDSWFGKTPGAKQLRAFTRLRAIENRRSIVRSSNGGISCFIDPFGRIYGEIPWFTSTISTAEVLCVNKLSFYTQHPDWFIKALLVLFSVFIIYKKLLTKGE